MHHWLSCSPAGTGPFTIHQRHVHLGGASAILGDRARATVATPNRPRHRTAYWRAGRFALRIDWLPNLPEMKLNGSAAIAETFTATATIEVRHARCCCVKKRDGGLTHVPRKRRDEVAIRILMWSHSRMSTSTNLAWPPPPFGSPRHVRMARNMAMDTTQPAAKGQWYASLAVTMLAFVFFPPLGLVLAARFHGLWQRPVWVRIAAITITAVFVVTLFAANGNSSDSDGPRDGGPLLTNVETRESLEGSPTTIEHAPTAPTTTSQQRSVGSPDFSIPVEDVVS